jgi:malonyl-CoA/methylmalonyl-CoA synthetase
VALEFAGRTYTLGEIDDRSNRMAALFGERGLEAGDRLCVYLSNCLELIDIYLGCVKSGVIFVPINILYREREILHILTDSEPKADAVGIRLGTVLAGPVSSARARQRPEILLDGDAPAAIVYTSGTTGVPNGAIRRTTTSRRTRQLITC